MHNFHTSFGRPNPYRSGFLPRNGVNKRESIARPMTEKPKALIGSRRFNPTA